MTSVIIDQENPEGLDSALRVLASLLVRQYIAEKKVAGNLTGSDPVGSSPKLPVGPESKP